MDRFCLVSHACSYTLKQGVIVVGFTSIITSIGALFFSSLFFLSMASKEGYNSDPMNAINLLTALICTSTSVYQIIISILMLWFLRCKKTVLLLSLWFSSNVWLLIVYSILIVARTVICIRVRECVQAFFNLSFGIIHEAVYSYFCIIVNSYDFSMDPEIVIF